MFEERLAEWVEKVLAAYKAGGATNTYQMMIDVDQIIADGFDHSPLIEE